MDTKTLFLESLNNVPKDISIEIDLSFDIANRIDTLLSERGLSQKEFAEMMGKRESEISKWLRGSHNFTIRTLAKISAALDCPLVQVAVKQPNMYEQKRYAINVNLLITPSQPKSSYIPVNKTSRGYDNYTQIPIC